MIDLLRLLPSFWYQARPGSAAWDEALNAALDEFGVTEVNRHDCRVGPFEVWLSNYPYAFGYNLTDPLEALPRVLTRLRLRREVRKYQAAEYRRQVEEFRS